MLLELNNVKPIPDKLCPLVFSLIYSLFGVTCLKACGYYSGCCAATLCVEMIYHVNNNCYSNKAHNWILRKILGVLSHKKILVTTAYLPKGCAIILFILVDFTFESSIACFHVNTAMLGGSPYKQPPHSPWWLSPYQLIEQPCHTLGGPLTKPLSEPLAL